MNIDKKERYENLYKTINILNIDFLKEQWKYLILIIIISIIILPINQILQPILISNLIKLLPKLNKNKGLFDFGYHIKEKTAIYYIYLIMSFLVLLNVGEVITHGLDIHLRAYQAQHIRKIISNKILDRYKNDYENIKIGGLLERLANLIRLTNNIWMLLFQVIIPEGITALSIIIYFSFFDLQLSFYLLSSIVISVMLFYLAYDTYEDYGDVAQTYNIDISNKITDTFNNLMNIYINNNIKKEKDLLNETFKKEVNAQKKLKLFENFYTHFVIFISMIFVFSAFFRLLHINKIKNLSVKFLISSFMILLNFNRKLGDTLWKLGSILGWYLIAMSYNADFINNILLYNDEKNIKNNINKGKIIFDNICFKYNKQDNKYLFKDFSFIINSNDKVAIIGSSGSGKSTLMKMIINLYKPDKGSISIDNININNIDTEYLRNNVMYVNQNTVLFDKSVLYNIKYGNETINNYEILKIIQKYELQTVYKELQNGLESDCGVNGNNLSLGMQKTTIILRAVLNKSKIIIMDEPLAGLDSETRQKIIKLIITESKNKTLLVVTHDKEILPYMNKVINLKTLKNN